MSTTDTQSAPSEVSTQPGTITMGLEVVTLPVSDADRSKRFYLSLGWRLDADIAVGDEFRIVQFTPPHSPASIHFGVGLTTAEPGSFDRLYLAVSDVSAARDDLIRRGVEVSGVFHYDRVPGRSGEFDSRVPGPEPANSGTYSTYASFNDPDGNGWLLQQITTRLPGRLWED